MQHLVKKFKSIEAIIKYNACELFTHSIIKSHLMNSYSLTCFELYVFPLSCNFTFMLFWFTCLNMFNLKYIL